MKDVLIKIKSTQSDGSQNEVIEFTTVGKLYHNDSKLFLEYEETEALGSGVSGVNTVLTVESDRIITMQRNGTINSRMIIESGKRQLCHYGTMYGEMIIGIFGESLKNKININGGELYMSYTIDINSELLSRNQVEISVSEVKNNVKTC